jgi:hypothetical protein
MDALRQTFSEESMFTQHPAADQMEAANQANGATPAEAAGACNFPGPTGWIWAEDGETYGLSIDMESRTLRWFVNAGCLCDHDDSTVDQTPAVFLASGVPGAVAEPDAQTLAEMQAAAQALAG